MKTLVKETHDTRKVSDFKVRTTHIKTYTNPSLTTATDSAELNVEVKEFEYESKGGHSTVSIWAADATKERVMLFDLENERYSLSVGSLTVFFNQEQYDTIREAFIEGAE